MKIVFITIHLNNYKGFIQTLNSVKKFSKKGHHFQWLIKDGKSKLEIVNKIKSALNFYETKNSIQLISESDNGIYDAMNQALSHVDNSSYVIFLNAGDQLSDDFIEHYSNEDFGKFDIIYSNTLLLDSNKLIVAPVTLDFVYLFGKTINHQSLFVNSSILKKYPFKLEYSIVADWVQLMEILSNENLRIKKLDYPISIYEGGGISDNQNDLRIEQRLAFLKTRYSSWELQSLMNLSRIRQRSWFDFIIKALDSPKRSKMLTWISKLF